MNFDNKLIQISTWMYYLIPLALLTGPFIPDLIISTIAIIFIYISLKQKYFEYFKNKFFYVFILFYFFLIFSSLISDFRIHSLESSLFYFRFGIFSLATWFLINNNENFIKNFTYIFTLIFLITLIDAFYQNFNDINIFGFSTEKNSRLILLLNDRAYLGGYLSRLIPLLIGLIILNFSIKRNKSYFFICLLLIFTDIAVYLSGERTAIALLFIASLSIILFIKNFRILRIFTLGISLCIMLVISVISPDIKERNIDRTYNQIFQQKQGKIAFFSVHHESHYITAYNMFKDKPVIGHGPNTFRHACSINKYHYNEKSCSTHPHNIYMQLLAETGVLGLLIFSILPIYLIYLLLNHFLSFFNPKLQGMSDFQVCLITAFILTIFPFLPSQNFFNNYINIIFYMPVGFFLYSLNREKFAGNN